MARQTLRTQIDELFGGKPPSAERDAIYALLEHCMNVHKAFEKLQREFEKHIHGKDGHMTMNGHR